MRRVLAFFAMLLAPPVLAEVAVFGLEHREASALVPLLQPVVDEGVVLRADGRRLIVRAPDGGLSRVRSLIRELDQPPVSLRVSLRTQSVSAATGTGASAGLRLGPQDARGGVRVRRTREARERGGVQRVRVLAGRSAWVDTGGTLRITERAVAQGRDGVAYQERERLQRWRDGFSVVPRLVGEDRVAVTLSLVREPVPGADDTASRTAVLTTVRGRLGEWLTVSELEADASSGDSVSTRDARRRRMQLELRVDTLGHGDGSR